MLTLVCRTTAAPAGKLAQRIGKAVRRAGAASASRVYADVNVAAPRDYWDYEALTVAWGDQDAYEVVKKVGRGKYSEVFEGVKTASDERCIIKARLRSARCHAHTALTPLTTV